MTRGSAQMSKAKKEDPLPNGMGRRIYVWLGYKERDYVTSLYGDCDYRAHPGKLEHVAFEEEVGLCQWGLHAAKLRRLSSCYDFLFDAWNQGDRYGSPQIACFLCLIDEHPQGIGGNKVVSTKRVLFPDEWEFTDQDHPRNTGWHDEVVRRIAKEVRFNDGAAYYTGPAFWDESNPVLVGTSGPERD